MRDHHDDLSPLADRIREAFVPDIPAALADAHVAAMVATEPEPAVVGRRWPRRIAKAAGVAVAAAVASSGLAYAGVPAVPNPVQAVVDVATNRKPLPEHAPQHARDHKDAVNDYKDALSTWHDCVKEAKESHDAEADGPFDKEAKEAACESKPKPQDFEGMTGPAEPAEKGQSNEAKTKRGGPDTTDDDDGSGPPSDHPTKDEHPGGKPEDVPPTGRPTAPPAE